MDNKGKAGGIIIPDLKLPQSYYNKISMVLTKKNRPEDLPNGTEDADSATNTVNHVLFNKEAKHVHCKKDIVSLIYGAENTDFLHAKD